MSEVILPSDFLKDPNKWSDELVIRLHNDLEFACSMYLKKWGKKIPPRYIRRFTQMRYTQTVIQEHLALREKWRNR